MRSVGGKLILLIALVLPVLVCRAAIDTYEFKDDATRDRFHVLTQELRCPKCQNQNLADSNAPIATDLRAEVYRLLSKGMSDREIKDYLVDRYGEYVLYKPEWSQQTWLLWSAPAILLLGGLVALIVIVRRRRMAADGDSLPELSAQEQAQVKQLLESETPDKDREK